MYNQNPYNPFADGVELLTAHDRLNYQGAFVFSTHHFSLVAPTKTGSTSLREYFADAQLKETDVIWDKSPRRIAVLRHPQERYYSGLIEMLNYPFNGADQSFDESWRSHVYPVCTILDRSKLDFDIILLKNLKDYIPRRYFANRTIVDGDSDPVVMDFYRQVKAGRDKFAELHRSRDEWWLRQEITAFSEILRTHKVIDPQEFKLLVKRSYRT